MRQIVQASSVSHPSGASADLERVIPARVALLRLPRSVEATGVVEGVVDVLASTRFARTAAS
jgi:hypothetical protein